MSTTQAIPCPFPGCGGRHASGLQCTRFCVILDAIVLSPREPPMKTSALVVLAVLAFVASPVAAKTAQKAEAHAALAVPFIADDYETALKTAREKNVPIFVDA